MKKLFYILLLVCGWLPVKSQVVKNETSICGKADFLKDGDTVSLVVYKYGIHYTGEPFTAEYTSVVQNQTFGFKWEAKGYPQAVYIQFKGHGNRNLNEYIIQSGDRIYLRLEKGALLVHQQLDSSFQVQNQIKAIENVFYQAKSGHLSFTPNNLENYLLRQGTLATRELAELINSKTLINPVMYEYLKHNFQFNDMAFKYHHLHLFGSDKKGLINQPLIDSFKRFLAVHPDLNIIINTVDINSPAYINYLYFKYESDSCLLKGQKINMVRAISFFSEKYTGVLREQLITQAISQNEDFTTDLSITIKNILPYIHNPEYLNYIGNTLSRIDGAKAYNFLLFNINEKPIQLTDFTNKVVVLDFWYTGCGNCRQLAPYMVKIENQFVDEQVVFIGIGVDKQKDQWIKSMQSGDYVSPHIVNLYTGGKGANDPVTQHYHVDGYPTLVLISKSGNIVNLKADPRMDNGRELTAKIKLCLN
jgi:thiol-disulfide isomerase/thioredoxin